MGWPQSRHSWQVYDPRDVPIDEKRGITLGMSMTERQGGSDVRANTTVASPVDSSRVGPGCEYLLNGHKWFTSAPMVRLTTRVFPLFMNGGSVRD